MSSQKPWHTFNYKSAFSFDFYGNPKCFVYKRKDDLEIRLERKMDDDYGSSGSDREGEREIPWHATRKRVTLRGLHDVLKPLFYPNYEFEVVMAEWKLEQLKKKQLGILEIPSIPRLCPYSSLGIVGGAPWWASSTASQSSHWSGSGGAGAGGAKGMKKGRLVDANVNSLVNNTENKGPAKHRVDAKTLELFEESTPWHDVDHDKLSRTDPLAQLACRTLLEAGYVPEIAQGAVGYLPCRLATGFDSIWRHNETHGKILIELKKCETFYYRRFCGKMNYPFQDIDDSAHNQHQLQLGFTLWMLRKTHPYLVIEDAFVLRVHSKGHPEYIQLEPWVLERIHKTLNLIKDLTALQSK